MKSLLLKIVLFAVIIFMGYMVYESINKPLKFTKERAKREAVVVQRLKDIRNVQSLYKQANNKYAASFDSLLAYLNSGEIPVVKLIPDPTDTTFTKTISDTLGYVKVTDSLFSERVGFNPNNLRFIPFSEGEVFVMDAGSIDRGGVNVSVFEAKAPFTAYLKGMEEQRINNLIAGEEDIEKYPGLKVGSMTEPSTDGNWE
ncbi:MAG: dihydrofolate reductase [Bacteroidales bacterium]|nr:dihydrofolate reductase [Bacteroidales bacterium]